jgi:polyhydroxybutyrate depolymerase
VKKLKRIAWISAAVVVGLPLLLVVLALLLYEFFDRGTDTLVVGNETREYLLYVPESYEAAKPVPLVISLHGAALWPRMQRVISGWNDVADEEGFIVVYPAGLPIVAGHWLRVWRLWSGLTGSDDTAPETRFIADLIDALIAQYNIDPTRIYADGYSNGGGMANLLACRLPDRFAAIGAVAATRLSWDRCDGFKPTPLIAIHGTADDGVPYDGGTGSAFDDYEWDSIATWIGGWAQRNGCGSSPRESVVAADVQRVEYSDCASGANVVLYTVEGGGHAWPGRPSPEVFVGHVSNSINATRELWAFYRKHRRATEQRVTD